MQNMQEYKCPCCGGAIAFDSTIQKMKCPYCETEFELEALKGYDAELQNEQPDRMDWETSAGGDWQEGETDGLRSYVCKSCGGEIVSDANTAATTCPFCDNPVVMMGQFSGALRPDLVIPFKLDKKAAKAGLMKHLTGKRLLPKVFRDQNHIDEIKGVYVPFWLYDTDVDAQVRYRATRVNSWSDSDYKQVAREMKLKSYATNKNENIMLKNWCNFQKSYTQKLGVDHALSLKKALTYAGLDFEGRAHDALFDARNTAELVAILNDDERFEQMLGSVAEALHDTEISSTLGDLFDFSQLSF